MKTEIDRGTVVLKWIVLVTFVWVVSYFVFWLWGGIEKYKRITQCGPSESITKPMAEAIVKEINKRGTLEKIVKLDSLRSLPYKLEECEKAIYDKLKEKNYDYLQTCTFNDKKKKYAVRLEYTKLNDMYIYIYKIDVGKFDFTEIQYMVLPYIGEYIHTDKWHIQKSTQTNYSEKSKGTCKYKRPLRF